jgi:hypothetical protein
MLFSPKYEFMRCVIVIDHTKEKNSIYKKKNMCMYIQNKNSWLWAIQ